MAIADTGTLATTGEDGVALGTFASYRGAKQGGDVVLRMRADALHTLNIGRDTRCSLYVQPSTQPPRGFIKGDAYWIAGETQR